MMAITLTESSLLIAKRALEVCFPAEKSSHLTESLAAACGFKTNAALVAARKPVDPDIVLLSEDAFFHRLNQLSSGASSRKTNFAGFELLPYSSRQDVISTWSGQYPKIQYGSIRLRAWRNAMVSGINAGLAKRLFSVRPGDNRWDGATSEEKHRRGEVCIFHFMIDDIPAMASVSDAGFDELVIHVALWPTPDAEKWITSGNVGFHAGDLVACGWLERRSGAWLQATPKPGFACRMNRLATGAELTVEPVGYADRGTFQL